MIVVAGEALVDLVEDGDQLRPVPGGGPFNTAIALGRLGLPVAFVGTLSRDGYGSLLGDLLADAGVDTSLVRRSDAPTPLAIVHRGNGGANTYTFYLTGTSFADLPQDALPELPKGAIALHVGTLGLAVDPPAGAFEALLVREAGRRAIVLDPNVRPPVFGDQGSYRERFERLAARATVVKLSDGDAAWIYPGLEPAVAMERVLALGPQLVAVTLGPHGAIAATSDARARVAAVPFDVVDTVGAGDTFGAALLAALIEQDALKPDATIDEAVLERTLSFAATAAAITCTQTGAVPPSRADIDARLTWHPTGSEGEDACLRYGHRLTVRTRAPAAYYRAMTGFWKRLIGRRDQAANERAANAGLETPAARRLAAEGVEGLAADEVVQERLGGTDPERLVDDEFTP